MADYGAMILMDNGNPFVTPQSTPFCLYRKVVVDSVANGTAHGASASIPLDATYSAIAFCRTSDTAQPTYVSAIRSGSNIMVGSGNPYGQAHRLTAYIFAIFPQTLPNWGIAIWDAAGKLVLTNESRVLSDLVTIGTPGSNGGINIDQTLSGSYAVCPGILGSTLIQVMVQGQPQVIAATAYTGCRYNGSTSRISAASSSNASGSVVGNTNNGNAIIAIKTDAYD